MIDINAIIWLIIDLDGIILGRVRERKNYDEIGDYILLLKIIKKIRKNCDLKIIALTDRGVAQLPPLFYILNGSRFQIGESGAAAYDLYTHSILINPQFEDIVNAIKVIRAEFEKKFGKTYALEPGVHSSIRVERYSNDIDFRPVFNFFDEIVVKNKNLLGADHGDCASLKPKFINKGVGIAWLNSLYTQHGMRIDFSKALWIGDGRSDIPAAHYIVESGGKISGVGNSQDEYKKFILDNNSYLAKESHTLGTAEILDHYFGTIRKLNYFFG